LLKQEKS
jgi:hypothetical protein